MPIALDPTIPGVFVFKEERDKQEDQQSKFFLRIPTKRDFIEIQKEVGKFRDITKREAKAFTLEQTEEALSVFDTILCDFLMGWENFKNAHGEEVTFEIDENGKCKSSNLDRFSIQHLSEMLEGLLEMADLTDEQVKNSK